MDFVSERPTSVATYRVPMQPRDAVEIRRAMNDAVAACLLAEGVARFGPPEIYDAAIHEVRFVTQHIAETAAAVGAGWPASDVVPSFHSHALYALDLAMRVGGQLPPPSETTDVDAWLADYDGAAREQPAAEPLPAPPARLDDLPLRSPFATPVKRKAWEMDVEEGEDDGWVRRSLRFA